MNGKVYLMGAGPGDPDLLTVKAQRLLSTAEVVLFDDLVSPGVLALAAPNAELRNVGKRCGKKRITQEEINFLMIALAESGRQVVRLKSGDPMIFGRLGEELEALRRAGIEYEIVPGVTSAFGAAAALEIPLTHRHASSALVLLTGRRASHSDETDWRKFVSSGATLAIYMPGQDYAEIASRLTNAGMAPETPCAIVSRANTPQQQSRISTVSGLNRSERLPAPTLLIVGEVVRSAHEIANPAATHGDSATLQQIPAVDLPGLLASAGLLAQDKESRR
jgi:uroporphyrin-III C-methyltransferase